LKAAGPAAFFAAHSAAISKHIKPETAAKTRFFSTAAKVPITDAAIQPVPTTSAIKECPLRIK